METDTKEAAKDTQHKNKKDTEAEQKIKDLTDTLQRVQADFENYKKRAMRIMDEQREFATEELIKAMLPLLDNFEHSIINKDNSEEFIKAVESIYAQFVDLLKRQGLSAINSENQKFDPYLHEALLSEKSDKEKGIILEEFQKGYLLKDKVIRHSKIKVSK